MESTKRLIIITGTNQSIAEFKKQYIPRTDSFKNNKHVVLDMNNINNIDNMSKTIEFIESDKTTDDVKDIFLFIHNENIEEIKKAINDLLLKFKKRFQTVKFVYLVSDDEELDTENFENILKFKDELNLDLNLEDLFSEEIINENMEILREKLYLIGDIVEIGLIANNGELPSNINRIVSDKLTTILNNIEL